MSTYLLRWKFLFWIKIVDPFQFSLIRQFASQIMQRFLKYSKRFALDFSLKKKLESAWLEPINASPTRVHKVTKFFKIAMKLLMKYFFSIKQPIYGFINAQSFLYWKISKISYALLCEVTINSICKCFGFFSTRICV